MAVLVVCGHTHQTDYPGAEEFAENNVLTEAQALEMLSNMEAMQVEHR